MKFKELRKVFTDLRYIHNVHNLYRGLSVPEEVEKPPLETLLYQCGLKTRDAESYQRDLEYFGYDIHLVDKQLRRAENYDKAMKHVNDNVFGRFDWLEVESVKSFRDDLGSGIYVALAIPKPKITVS